MLRICHQALHLPSNSTIKRMLSNWNQALQLPSNSTIKRMLSNWNQISSSVHLQALQLPSNSTIKRMLSNWNQISSSVHLQPKDYLTRNFHYVEENGPIYGYMMKIDDTYTDARVCWNSADNERYGFCYQHAAGKDTSFSSYNNVDSLAQEFRSGDLHVPKESMVIALSCNSATNYNLISSLLFQHAGRRHWIINFII